MLRTIFAVFGFILLNFAFGLAQDTAQTSPNLETILSEAQKQTEFYKETFRNLLAEETKIFEEFDKTGNSDQQTAVKSNFLVYQSGRNANVTTELRNVVEVNGKPVPNSQKRSGDFLAELEKTTTLEKELNKIQREGSKYDKTIEVYGLTLNEAIVLSPNIRPFFEFKLLGAENYQGNDVYVISYQQTKKSPYNVVNGKDSVSNEASYNFALDIPGALKNNDTFLRGKLWIDAKNFQLRREEQELTVNAPAPLTLLTTNFEYQPSNYEILVPKTISITTYKLRKQKADGKFIAVKDTNVNFDYSKFRQTNVEVKILDDK
ncbi:MAG: hypothetical protein H0U50_07925 [Pyrinomonadaceae bacterium]|nr:hypothetical protein [Pyrinomonadaceae bacterium]